MFFYITIIVIFSVNINICLIEANHVNTTTETPTDTPVIQAPIEGFGDFFPPEDHNENSPQHKDVTDHERTNLSSSFNKPDNFETTQVYRSNREDELNTNHQINMTYEPEISVSGDIHFGQEEGCNCRDIHGLGVVCQCIGESITQVPSNLSQRLTRLHMISMGIEVLHRDAFRSYENLTDLYMEYMKKLRLIEAGVFSELPHLRSVSIKFAPQLKHIPNGVFLGPFPGFKDLRIVKTGLEVMPPLSYPNKISIISMLDFDSNKIRNLTSHSITVKAGYLNLDYNMIESVQNWAFFGSEIAKLSLKGNRKLVYLQEKAFEGLKSLTELDLSQTSISKLPILGLQELEILRLVDTFTLKEFPSVYNFKNIKEAYLTYPYHCCAFKFPATHNPKEFAKYQELFKKDMKKRYCPEGSTQKSPSIVPLERKRRHLNKKTYLISIYDETRHKAVKLINQVLDIFDLMNNAEHNNDKTQFATTPASTSLFQKRHLNEFGQILSSGTRNPLENNTAYGRVIYKPEDINQTESFVNSMAFEKIRGLQQNDGPTYSTKITTLPTLGFAVPPLPNNENVNKDGKYPINIGTFGTPIATFGPQQEFCGDFAVNYPDVKCSPIPDAFNPCEDVMGNAFLRMLVWIVVVAAILGNSAVMVVLMSGRFTFNVSKFLMINLAIADLMMGVYLLIIAVVDLRTVGVYFNYAIDWQHGSGCKIAGFITVFASELSIFTLTVITLERWFAITFAIQLNKRLKLGLAVKVMIGGWIYALVMASLPLLGISAYSKTSICLPMENKEIGDVAYLISLLTINGLAFLLISACYAKMYCSIISQQTRATINDMTIAKRMALLVFTDFVCWAPIAFFGLTAIAGYPLIDVPKSKFLLVTFYPLNSLCNPFLYAILTKQYRRDFFILVSRYGFCTKRAMKYKNASSHGHHRIATLRSNNAVISGSIFSQVSCDGNVKHHYKYVCQGHGHHHGYYDDNNSCRSVVYSTVDIYPECSSRSNSRSNDSTHEIVKIAYNNCTQHTGDKHKKRGKKVDVRQRKYSVEIGSSEEESTSSSLHKGSPHPVRNSHTRVNRLPSGEQQEILARVLQMDKMKCCAHIARSNSCRGKCPTCIQRDSSSGEKSVVDYDSELLHWTKSSRNSKCPVENASFVMSSHSNSANEDTEI